MAGQLVVSVSGISDRTLPEVEAFCAQLDERDVPVSFLVAPRIKGGYRLDGDAPTVEWLAGRRESGDAVVLHGFDEAATKKRRGEFATLQAHEANLRLMAADRVLEHLGLRTRLFAATIRPSLTENGGRPFHEISIVCVNAAGDVTSIIGSPTESSRICQRESLLLTVTDEI